MVNSYDLQASAGIGSLTYTLVAHSFFVLLHFVSFILEHYSLIVPFSPITRVNKPSVPLSSWASLLQGIMKIVIIGCTRAKSVFFLDPGNAIAIDVGDEEKVVRVTESNIDVDTAI